MKYFLRFLLAFSVAFGLMLIVRAVGVTIYTVEDERLHPDLEYGDRVLVNRWSYGLRIAGGGLFSYGRIGRQPVRRGDLVALTSNFTTAFFRCKAVPGDTVMLNGTLTVVPGVEQCADADYYLMESIGRRENRRQGLVKEEQIIGRAVMVVYCYNKRLPLWWERIDPYRFFYPL